MNKGKVIAFANQKGGVGKTTTIVNFAISLAETGKKVLLIDMDTQAHATQYFGVPDPGALQYTIGNALNEVLEDGMIDAKKIMCAHHHRSPNLRMLGSNRELHKIKSKLTQESITGADRTGQFALKKVIDPLREAFDYILIDCAPSLDIDLINALVASDEVMIITTAASYSYDGAEELIQTVYQIRKSLNPALQIAGAVINSFDGRNKFSPAMEAMMREVWEEGLGIKVFKTVIPRSIRVDESQCESLPMKYYAPDNKVTRSYDVLVAEYLAASGDINAVV